MDNTEDLRLLLASRHPLLLVETRDETRFLQILRRSAESLGLPVWTWTVTRGLARDGAGPQYQTADARRALDFVADLEAPGVFAFIDVHPSLEDPVVLRRVKEVAHAARPGQTILLTGPRTTLPVELQGLALPWRLRPPSVEELTELVRRTLADLRARDFPVSLDDDDIDHMAAGLRGVSLAEAERLVQRAAVRDGQVDRSDLDFVRSAKAELLGETGVLELIEGDHGTLDDVGGMATLKDWLDIRRAVFLEPRPGLDPPRGVLLTGVPGCGKSFLGKTLARTWQLPLVLLDPGRLYGPYVGESEQRLAEALSTIEALAPAVLWIDEIEKGFAAPGGGDGGVSRRLLGTFLRWLQDRPAGVFIVATCNDVTALPPELERKGRFDEVFFVDLPVDAERRDIFASQLRKRACDPKAFGLDELARSADGFSGAEIEAAVVSALYRAHAAGCALGTDHVAEELRTTVPLSRSRPEEIDALRVWARGRAVAAGGTASAATRPGERDQLGEASGTDSSLL